MACFRCSPCAPGSVVSLITEYPLDLVVFYPCCDQLIDAISQSDDRARSRASSLKWIVPDILKGVAAPLGQTSISLYNRLKGFPLAFH